MIIIPQLARKDLVLFSLGQRGLRLLEGVHNWKTISYYRMSVIGYVGPEDGRGMQW